MRVVKCDVCNEEYRPDEWEELTKNIRLVVPDLELDLCDYDCARLAVRALGGEEADQVADEAGGDEVPEDDREVASPPPVMTQSPTPAPPAPTGMLMDPNRPSPFSSGVRIKR